MNVLSALFLLFSVVSVSYCSNETETRGARIINGATITINAAPYQVSVRLSGNHFCGGSIISRNVILTAAHCTYGRSASAFSIRAGSRDKQSGGQVIAVNQIVQHPNYRNDRTYDYDFSILGLKASITLDGSTKSIVRLSAVNEVIPSGTSVFVSGWGETNNAQQSTRYLRGVVTVMQSSSYCNSKWSPKTKYTNRMICALYQNKGSCNGDSGGPVKVQNTNKLVGVVSYGTTGCDTSYPSVFANIASVRSWIKDVANI